MPNVNDVRSPPQLVRVVGPQVHHGPAFLEVGRMVVGCGHLVTFLVGLLQLDRWRALTRSNPCISWRDIWRSKSVDV